MVRALGFGRRTTATCLAALLGLASTAPAQATDASESPGAASPAASVEPAASSPPGSGGPRSWIATELGQVRAVASGSVPFVAVGSDGFPPQAAAWSSADGLTWEAATVVDPPVGSTMTAVVPLGQGFAALGHESVADEAEGNRILAWHSSDGTTWEPVSLPRPARSQLQAVLTDLAGGAAGELALGSYIGQDLAGQRLWLSTDGQTWASVDLPGAKGAIFDAVAAVPDGFLLMGQTAKGKASNWRSTDGRSWKRVKDSPRLFGLASAPDGVSVGIGWKDLWVSPDLATWEKTWTRPKSWPADGRNQRVAGLDGSNAFEWVAWDGDEFLVAGHDFGSCPPNTDECHLEPLLVSADGRTWTESFGPDGQPGADAATWLEGTASSGEATIIEGQTEGTEVVWLVQGDLVPEELPA